MSRAFCTPLCFLLLAAVDSAQDLKDQKAIAAECAEARKAHEIGVAKAKEGLTQAFDKTEKAIRDDSSLKAEQQLDLLRQHRKLREAFEKNGTLPDAPRMKAAVADYRRAMAATDEQLDSTYERAIKAYTKLGLDAKAEALLAEKTTLLTDRIDGRMFRVGTVWEGHHVLLGRNYPAKLTITSRDGEKFEAKLSWVWNNEPEAVTRVEGKLVEKAITFRSTKVEKGMGILHPAEYDGKIDGGVASGTWVYKGPVGETKGEFRYTPAPRGKK